MASNFLGPKEILLTDYSGKSNIVTGEYYTWIQIFHLDKLNEKRPSFIAKVKKSGFISTNII